MLISELGKLKRSMIMTSICMIAVGILMLICPDSYVGMLVAILGYGLLIFATVMFLGFLSSRKVLINYIYLTGAMLIALLGLAALFYRDDTLRILGLLFGIFLVVDGLYELFNTWMYARRAQRKGWWFLMLLSICLIASGIIIFTNPWWDTPAALMRVIGGMMFFTSAVGIVHVILTWPFKNA